MATDAVFVRHLEQTRARRAVGEREDSTGAPPIEGGGGGAGKNKKEDKSQRGAFVGIYNNTIVCPSIVVSQPIVLALVRSESNSTWRTVGASNFWPNFCSIGWLSYLTAFGRLF